jgi:hypothetical protein
MGVGNGITADVDRLRMLGNAVVPQVAEWIGRKLMVFDRKEQFENEKATSYKSSDSVVKDSKTL